ncbi:MAG: D-2-hydroxyacid dehydrogenase [Woeseiaceae bacterium]
MHRIRLFAAILVLGFAIPAFADITIDELVRQAGILEGDVAARDLPNWRGAKRIMISRVGPEDLDALRRHYPDTDFVQVSPDSIDIAEAKDVDAIIGLCDERLIAAAPRLVWIQIFWAGAESCLSVPRVGSGEVVLTNMQKMSAPVIAEHSIAMALALARALPVFAKQMLSDERSGLYAARRGMVPLAGKTMLVVGLGGIGTEAARRAAALGMRVIGTRNSSRDGPEFVEYVGLADELLELAGRADVIVNALPLTSDTEGLLDKSFFDATKRGVLFVNVGRGATVDTDALVAALKSGQVGGAGLDVTEPEPLPADHELWQLENVIITPHVAGYGGERERHMTLLKDNLRRYAAGDRLLNVVDPAKGY